VDHHKNRTPHPALELTLNKSKGYAPTIKHSLTRASIALRSRSPPVWGAVNSLAQSHITHANAIWNANDRSQEVNPAVPRLCRVATQSVSVLFALSFVIIRRRRGPKVQKKPRVNEQRTTNNEQPNISNNAHLPTHPLTHSPPAPLISQSYHSACAPTSGTGIRQVAH